MMDPTTPTTLKVVYAISGDKVFSWFCPSEFETQEIDVYACVSNEMSSCLSDKKVIGKTFLQMDVCKEGWTFNNYIHRVETCMPWELWPNLKRYQIPPPNAANVGYDFQTGGMRHLRTQFATFEPVRQWYDPVAEDQSKRVSICVSGQERIEFSSVACWHKDPEVVFLKPQYKFKFRTTDNPELCVLSSKASWTGTGIPSYKATIVNYIQQPENIPKKFTYCKWWGYDKSNPFWWGVAFAGEYWNRKEIQFHDYVLNEQSLPCPDSVTQACVDNVFSFFAAECVWVKLTSEKSPLSLNSKLRLYPPEDVQSFENYGGSMYTMNLAMRKIDAWIKLSDAHKFEKWNGEAKKIDMRTASLYFKEKDGYSCSGCLKTGEAQKVYARSVSCGVPQECERCKPWQRVDNPFGSLSLSECEPPFEVRQCVACGIHNVRSTSDEKQCVPCPQLTPMRLEKQDDCLPCEHTQWFDVTNQFGCAYLMSVADGLSFTGGTRFDYAYVDQYRPPGSTRRPEAVPALHYRNLVSDGNRWNASTSAERCPMTSFGVVNAIVGDVSRNVYARQIQFRRWCGHAEILKADDALLKPLNCGSRRPENMTSLGELVAGSAGVYELTKERGFVQNRIGEVKLTMLSDRFSCFYELRREGRAEDCRYCLGTLYTKDCGPTYYSELDTPAIAGPGTCVACDEQCSSELFPSHFFEVTLFSCWSNGTERVRGSMNFGSLKDIALTMSASMNYWYKPAPCSPCAKVSDATVPQIVTRCGNKPWFETWSAIDTVIVLEEKRPKRRFCCAMDNSNVAGNAYYDSQIGTRCVSQESELLMATATPLCLKNVPDLATNYTNFCPPGWFLDRSVVGCDQNLLAWNNACCSQCWLCEGAGRIKTDKYETCSGGTDHDTQLEGCVASCAEKNYEVDGTCVACESCA